MCVLRHGTREGVDPSQGYYKMCIFLLSLIRNDHKMLSQYTIYFERKTHAKKGFKQIHFGIKYRLIYVYAFTTYQCVVTLHILNYSQTRTYIQI